MKIGSKLINMLFSNFLIGCNDNCLNKLSCYIPYDVELD